MHFAASKHGPVKITVRRGRKLAEPEIVSVSPNGSPERKKAYPPQMVALQPMSPIEMRAALKRLRIRVKASPEWRIIHGGAKYETRCAGCGRKVRLGAEALFDPETKAVVHERCGY